MGGAEGAGGNSTGRALSPLWVEPVHAAYFLFCLLALP